MSTSTLHRSVLAIACTVILGALNFMVFAKERIVSEGVSVYLALAPVDPRAILQGDFMTLRFDLAAQLERNQALASADPQVPTANGEFRTAEITLDARSVATLATPGSSQELRIRYRNRGGSIWLGTNAFFFQEGDAARFEQARFGHFKLSKNSGEAILVGLMDENLRAL
jgi:uncharacterized membrane-anchored protein